MKILSAAEGEALLTNVEVLEWLKEKNFTIQRRDVPDGVIKPPSSTASLARHLERYLETCPSGAQTTKSARLLFERLSKFKLSSPELMMIANIRPEAYAHLTALIADVYSRFDEEQIYQILEIVNSTLEKRVKRKPSEEAEEDVSNADENNISQPEHPQDDTSHVRELEESRRAAASEAVSAQITDVSNGVQSAQVRKQEDQETHRDTDQTFENGVDATNTDCSAFAHMSSQHASRENQSHRRATR